MRGSGGSSDVVRSSTPHNKSFLTVDEDEADDVDNFDTAFEKITSRRPSRRRSESSDEEQGGEEVFDDGDVWAPVKLGGSSKLKGIASAGSSSRGSKSRSSSPLPGK